MSTEEQNNENLQDSGNSMEVARKLIEAVKKQFEEENAKILEFKKEMYRENDFKLSRFAFYDGPNYYLDRKAMVFNIFIAPIGDTVEYYKQKIAESIPAIAESEAALMADLFAETLLHVMKMDIDLYINHYNILDDGDEYIIAMEYLDDKVAKEAAYLVSDWFYAISKDDEDFDFNKSWLAVQAMFDKSLFGGPTIYSLYEAGLKRDIPIIYLFEENQFQWGYGKKQLRGRSTTFHNDGIKDTEMTTFKDMCGDFLDMCGFPTPKGFTVYTEEEAVEAAAEIGFPCVVKPVNGHKGEGVSTRIMSDQEVRLAFRKIIQIGENNDVAFQGILVQTMVYGTDHRLLAVGGKFAAALQRVPAFIEGDGGHTIKELIQMENSKLIRLDNARSPLCKINIDDDLIEFLSQQKKSLTEIPAQGEVITLRKVANISAGGVSYNVTEKIHPENIKLVEDIASYLSVRNLGIDVLAADISKSWKEGNFGIIEINAGPGVFMHLAPAYGGSIDVPAMIIMSHFKDAQNARIPIIATNGLSKNVTDFLNAKIHEIDPHASFGYLTDEGVIFDGVPFHNNPDHIQNEKIILRKPQVSIALFTETSDSIFDYGLLFRGADLIILDEATAAEEYVLSDQLLPNSPMIEIKESHIELIVNNEVQESAQFANDEEKDQLIKQYCERHLADIMHRYGDVEKLHAY
ncbi:MAG: acetate--CoA ligase family protein [Bacteroidales bacterium]|nr:acetate--CoA ligase family protein [Bacteroidales bacterium]